MYSSSLRFSCRKALSTSSWCKYQSFVAAMAKISLTIVSLAIGEKVSIKLIPSN